MGASRAHELIRQASRIVSEASEQATNGIPRVVDVIRKTETVAGDSALMLPATYQPVAGLTSLQATYFQPSEWNNTRPGTAAEVVQADRVLLIADVPAAGDGAADVILLTDRVRVDDPEFGLIDLIVTDVATVRGTGLVKVEASFGRDGVG